MKNILAAYLRSEILHSSFFILHLKQYLCARFLERDTAMTNERLKGFTYGAIAAASYGMNPLFALPLYGAGMNADSVLFYRYFLAIVMLGVLMKVKKQSFALKKTDILPLAVMGLLFSFSSLFLFESYNYMDAGIASTICLSIRCWWLSLWRCSSMRKSRSLRCFPSQWLLRASHCCMRGATARR